MSKLYNLKRRVSNLDDLVDGESAYGYPGDYPGNVYYVNNISGASGNTGTSWAEAFDQVSTAVTAAEAFRQAVAGTTNDYIRNIIYVQGTGTAYTKLTALPNYCDIIGVGANPRGNGTGIASITGSTSAAIAGSARGLDLYNLQFIGSGNYYAAAFAVLFRSVIENCVFVNGATGGLDITTGGGNTIRNCQIGCGDTVTSVTGMRVGSAGGNFNNCLVERNVIYGSTTGVANGAYLCNGTVFRENFIYGGTKGVDDTSAESTLAGNAWYLNNFIGGADAMDFDQNGTVRAIGNIINEAGTSTYEDLVVTGN